MYISCSLENTKDKWYNMVNIQKARCCYGGKYEFIGCKTRKKGRVLHAV